MKTNFNLRLAQAAMTAATLGLLMTSCSKEEGILPAQSATMETAYVEEDAHDRRGGQQTEDILQMQHDLARLAGKNHGTIVDLRDYNVQLEKQTGKTNSRIFDLEAPEAAERTAHFENRAHGQTVVDARDAFGKTKGGDRIYNLTGCEKTNRCIIDHDPTIVTGDELDFTPIRIEYKEPGVQHD